jgi:predicted nucleic acid-binding protein
VQKVVVDTNVYIDYFNDGRHESVMMAPDSIKYLSAVVFMELLVGASSPKEQRLLRALEADFGKARRVLTPSSSVFADAGDALRRLRRERGFQLSASNTIVNDVLIALSARSIGATVVTQNERDYRAIQKVRAFKLIVV